MGSAFGRFARWSRWTWGRPPCGEHSRARKACARKRSPPGARQIAGAIWLGPGQRRREPHCRITPPALRHDAPWCLANTVFGRRMLAGLEGVDPLCFFGEKCRSALGAERMLAPSPSLGPSILSTPNATDRRGEAAADGWWLQAEWVSTDGKIDSVPR